MALSVVLCCALPGGGLALAPVNGRDGRCWRIDRWRITRVGRAATAVAAVAAVAPVVAETRAVPGEAREVPGEAREVPGEAREVPGEAGTARAALGAPVRGELEARAARVMALARGPADRLVAPGSARGVRTQLAAG